MKLERESKTHESDETMKGQVRNRWSDGSPTVDGQIQWTVGSVGSIGFLADFEFYMAVLGVPSGPIGFVAALRFKWLDSQPEKSNMGPVWTDFHDFEHFQESCRGFLARYLPCFRPGAPKT